jgi:hypothetical protein
MSRWWFAALVFCVACKTKSNARYCDEKTPCTNARLTCDLVKNECVGAGPLDMAVPDLSVGRMDDLSTSIDAALVDGAQLDLRPPPACTSFANCTDPNLPICDTGTMTCRPCSSSADDSQCAAHDPAKPHCYLTTHTCQQCEPSVMPSQCANPTPVCGSDGNCRKCTAHTECASLICKSDGTCAADSDVLYVDNKNGACVVGTQSGMKNDPICDVPTTYPTAITTSAPFFNKQIVHYAASTTAYSALLIGPSSSGFSVNLVGSGAKISGNTAANPAPALTITIGATITVATVNVDGLDLQGSKKAGSVNTDSDGVSCSVSAGTGTINLNLRSVVVHDSGASGSNVSGVNATKCAVTIKSSQFARNADKGVYISYGSLDMDGSYVSANGNEGVYLFNGPSYTIINSMIYDNGLGVHFSTATNSGNATFAFNTVSRNDHGATNQSSGLDCGTSGPRHIIESSIVYDNGNNGGGSPTQIAGNRCDLAQVVTGAGENYAGATQSTPIFASSPADGLHLAMNDTACIDQARYGVDGGAPTQTDHDIDGQKRPNGTYRDIGADEFYP